MSLLFADIFEAIRCLRLCKGTTEKEITNYIQERVGGCLSVANSMFDFRHPLLEVVQAIETLQESRGRTNKQVCDFVRNQGKNPNDPMKVLKTIRTLHKLVEEGVLIKRGRRYLFPSKSGKQNDQDEEDEEEENEEENEEDEEMEMCDAGNDGCDEEDDEEGEEEDEDEDDDDDEEEEDEDEDEEDEEECDEKEMIQSEMDAKSNEVKSEETSEAGKTMSGHKNHLGPGQKSSNVSGKPSTNEGNGMNSVCATKSNGKKSSNRKNGDMENENAEDKNSGKNKGGEPIAFCARDFIDAQYDPNCGVNSQEVVMNLQEKPLDDTHADEKFDMEKAYFARRRESKSKRSRLTASNYRSRSPIKGVKAELYHFLKSDKSDDIGPDAIYSQLFQEPTDGDMEIDLEREEDGAGLDYDLYRHQSLEGPTPSKTPGVHTSRKESCCSNFDKKITNEVKVEPFEGEIQYSLKKDPESKHSLLKPKESQSNRLVKESGSKGNQSLKRDLSTDDEKHVKNEAHMSFCSVCEKKKKNS